MRNEQSQLKRVAMRVTTADSAIEAGPPEPFEVHYLAIDCPGAGHEVAGFNVCSVGF